MLGKRRSGFRFALAARPRLPARALPRSEDVSVEVGGHGDERGQLGLEGIEALSALTTADASADAGLSRALATRAGERIGRELRTALHLGLPSR